jgi:hypothetical protein
MDRACSTNKEKRNACMLLGKPDGKRPLRRLSRWWVDNIKMDLHWSCLGYWQVEGCCKHGNEPFGTIECWGFLHNWRTLKKGSTVSPRWNIEIMLTDFHETWYNMTRTPLIFLFWGFPSCCAYFIKVAGKTVPRNKQGVYIYFVATCFGPRWPSSGIKHNIFGKLLHSTTDPLFCVVMLCFVCVNTKQRIRCEWSNFRKIMCILPEDGHRGPKHVAAK